MSYTLSESFRAQHAPEAPAPPPAFAVLDDSATLADGWRKLMFRRRLDRIRTSPAPGLTYLGPWRAGWWLPSGVMRPGWRAWVQDPMLVEGCDAALASLGVEMVSPGASGTTAEVSDHATDGGPGGPASRPACELVLARLGPKAEMDLVRLNPFDRGAIVVGLQLDEGMSARALGQLQRRIRATGYDVVARDDPRRVVLLREGELER